MKAISKFAKRFQRKKQDDNTISVLVTAQQSSSEEDTIEKPTVSEATSEMSLHSNCNGIHIAKSVTSDFEAKKQTERNDSQGIKLDPSIEELQRSPSRQEVETKDSSIPSLTTNAVHENDRISQREEMLRLHESKLKDDSSTKISAGSFENTEDVQSGERTFSNGSVSQITNESYHFTKRTDNYSNEHTNSSGHSDESPDNGNLCDKKAKRRGRKTDLQTDSNSEKGHLSRKETQTIELTKRKSKNSVEVPASPISFTRYPWEEPGYAEGAGVLQMLSESELTREASDWLTILATIESEWSHRVAVLKRIRLILNKALKSNCQNITEIFSSTSMRNALILQTSDLRSSLVKEAFETIATICEQLGNLKEFFLTSALFLDKAVLLAVVKTTKVISKPAEECGKRIVASTAAEAVLPVLCSTIRFGVHPTAREKCTTLLLHILKRGPPLVRHTEEISFLLAKNQVYETSPKEIQGLQYSISEFTSEDSGLRSLESALASAIGDSHGSTREAGLSCLQEMEKHWPERTQELIRALDPSLRRRAISSLSSNSSQSTRSSAASSNRVRKSVKEWKAEAQKSRKNLETTNVFSEEPNVIAEDSIADATEKLAVNGQDSCIVSKGILVDNADNSSAIEHRSSKKTETSNSSDARKVRNRDSLRVR